MTNWNEILETIPPGTSEADLEARFVSPLLQELGLNPGNYSQGKSFSGLFKGQNKTVRPDFSCWFSPVDLGPPFLVVEDKKVDGNLINNAIREVQQQMVISKAKFGMATNGLQIQFFQRHKNICIPRTPLEDIYAISISDIIAEIKAHLESPIKALTMMFWNLKGGVGKTTITANIGATLAKKYKVLIINFDLQGDLNPMFGVQDMTEYQNPVTIFDALYDVANGIDEINPSQLVRTKKFEVKSVDYEVDVIPGDLSMFDVEDGINIPNRLTSLKMFLEKGFYNTYDYILIDASPAWRVAEMAARAVDIIIPVVDNSNFSILGVERLKEIYLNPEPSRGNTSEKVWEFKQKSCWNLNDSPIPPGIMGYLINTRFQNIGTVNTAANSIKTKLAEKVGIPSSENYGIVRNYAEIAKSVEKGKPVVYSDPNSKAAETFTELTNSIFGVKI
ncbi:MAG: ParA family protein [Cyanobacteriota bacterium]|nr:ParA family protein [Cyanobacteriota bacterium]